MTEAHPPYFKCKDCILKSLISENIAIPANIKICDSKRIKKYPKGYDVAVEGQEIRNFMYLKSGMVKLYKHNPDNQDQIIKIALPDNFIGLLSIFSEDRYNYSVTTLDTTEICFTDLDFIKEMIKINGIFALNILGNISKTADDIIGMNLEIGKRNLRGRIAYILLFFSRKVYHSDSFVLPVSRREIAELIDMTVENVIRIISEFGKDNILKVKRSHIEILDMNKLRKICDLG